MHFARRGAVEWVVLGRAAIAMLLVGALGFEREYRARPAGLRTHMLVGLSSTLFAGLGELYLHHHPQSEGFETDPLRVLQAVVTGVSFLGAGTVFVSRRRGIQGLTTAATLWTASAVGVACGLGHMLVAAGATVLALVALIAARWIEVKASPKDVPGSDQDESTRADIDARKTASLQGQKSAAEPGATQ
jgi:putative Mg2+ transporter-C (MgtC) family protein